MHIDPNSNSNQDNYKLLINLIVPRPIAWVTTQNLQGVINLAPFSYFNAVCDAPVYLIISIGNKDDGSIKDTGANIIASNEFVVNLVTEDLVKAMNVSAADFPIEESELIAIGLHAAKSHQIKVPRVLEAQASLECVLHSQQPLGAYTLFIGQVVMFYINDDLVDDRLHINGFAPVGRLGSPSYYCHTGDRFDLPSVSYEEWHSQGQKDIS
jgi:flavin reductase (DIM6/NTAB) family NADH-FMN oxidoreductase RutF